MKTKKVVRDWVYVAGLISCPILTYSFVVGLIIIAG